MRSALVRAALCVLFVASGCSDPHSIQGTMRHAAHAVERGDARAFYEVIDERARHAMISVVKDRERARAIIERSYPPEARAAALAELGDAVGVRDAPALFARRCDRTCLRAFGSAIGSPVRVEHVGDEEVVTTAKGSEVRLHRRGYGWYGIVWNTPALARERKRANQDLAVVRENASIYERRRVLEAAVSP